MASKNYKTQLDNGLMLIGEINPAHKSCGLGFFVKTGSRDETQEESGISHFLEHMMFKGTAKRNALQVSFDLGNIGAQANAFTSDENTVYYSAIIPDYFPALQELLTDMLRPSIEQSEFDTEKNVILEEIALYQDKPHFYLYENATRDFFGSHPLANSVLGSTESVSAISSMQMKDYFSRRYSASNMVLVATGNYDWERFVKDAAEQTKNWKPGESGRSLPEFKKAPPGKEFKRKNLSQSHMLLFSPACSATDNDRYALSVLGVILGDGTGSKFFWQLIDSGLAESASADHDDKDGAGVFSAFASTKPENVDKVSAIIKNIFATALDYTDEDLVRAKAKIVSRMIMSGELPMGRLMSLGMSWNFRREIHSLKNEIEAYKSVSRETIKAALGRHQFQFAEYRLMPE